MSSDEFRKMLVLQGADIPSVLLTSLQWGSDLTSSCVWKQASILDVIKTIPPHPPAPISAYMSEIDSI